MSTRSTISLYRDDGKIETIYCHFDGYLGYVGKLLFENYNTVDKIKHLLSLGDISELGEKCDIPEGVEHNFDNPIDGITVSYKRDRGEDGTDSYISDSIDNIDFMDYNYYFKDGNWYEYGYGILSNELINN